MDEKEFELWKKEVDEQQAKFKKTLYGNGEPGMDEDIRNIKAMLSVLIKLAWIVTGVAISMGISGFVAASVFIIREMAGK